MDRLTRRQPLTKQKVQKLIEYRATVDKFTSEEEIEKIILDIWNQKPTYHFNSGRMGIELFNKTLEKYYNDIEQKIDKI